MRTIDISEITTEQGNSSEQLLVNLLRTKYPNLDLRIGTALRDLLVTPDAFLHAWFSAQAEEQRDVASLQTLLERSNNGEQVDLEDINRVLSNFNLAGTLGTAARGTIKITVSSARTCVVSAGDEFETLDGIVFTADAAVIADENPSGRRAKLYRGGSNYYFLVPVTCTTTGSAGNIVKGTVLSANKSFAGFMTATAYGDFSGGADVESLSSLVSRIPVALSNRGLLTSTSVEALLRDRYDTSNNPIIAVSTVGYGNSAQLRDKHNPFGVGVGGRVDVYVRNFTAPHVVTLTKECKYDPESGDYILEISASDAPGLQQIYSVADADSSAIASYAYSVEYGGDSVSDTWHDFDVSSGSAELCGTVWRNAKVHVKNTGYSTSTHLFSADVVCLPAISDIQEYVDDSSTRNVGVDYVVRCPAICRVSINASCRYNYGTLFDTDVAKKAIADYINTSGFVGRITRSEIACVLKAQGATSVDITSDYMLVGSVIDAFGDVHRLSGDSLDIDNVENPSGLLTKDTCVFSTAVENINLTAIPA